MPKPVTLDDLVQRYTETIASMPALEANQEAWEQAASRLSNLRYKIKKLNKRAAEALPARPPSPFTARGQAKRTRPAVEVQAGPVHFDDAPPAAGGVEGHEPGDDEVTLEDLQERIQAARQELGSILSDAQLLTRADRAMLSIDMTELVIVANGVDAALTPHQVR